MHTCKNCGHKFEGKYCNNCSQSADTQRLNARFIWLDIKGGLLHVRKGIWYTMIQLFRRPGHMIRDYIDGKRVKYISPITLAVLLAATYALVIQDFHISLHQSASSTPDIEDKHVDVLLDWALKYNSWLMLLTLPLISMSSFICFRRQGYNFMEHIVLNAYAAAQRFYFSIIAMLLFLPFRKGPDMQVFYNALMVGFVLLTTWTYMQFFNKLPKIKVLFLSLLSALISFICFTVILVAVVMIMNA
jgi:hypothetical protein